MAIERGSLLADLRSIQVCGRLVAEWWREPVEYTGYVQYFATRSLAGAIRLMIGVGIGLIAGVSIAVYLSVAEQDSVSTRIVVVVFAALNAFWAVMWCISPWPTHRQSQAFVISSDLGIAAVALIGANWIIGLFALNCFALISVYLVFFDGPKALALHTVLIALTTIVFIALTRATAGADGGVVAGSILGAVIPVTTTPLGIQFGIRTLRIDANKSATDPLTGLLNRRGLHLRFGDLLQLQESHSDDVTVMVVDLDRFKEVNDSYGHAVGDEVLIRCARRIRTAAGSDALIARTGGEEFVIVALADPRRAQHIAERIRQSILLSGDRPMITASLGVTSVEGANFVAPGADPHQLLHALIARADQAMFDAKHDGGNTTRRI